MSLLVRSASFIADPAVALDEVAQLFSHELIDERESIGSEEVNGEHLRNQVCDRGT